MKRILILSALALLAATPFSYSNNPECDNLNIMLETKNDLNQTLNSFDFNFRESFDTPSVRGIQKSRLLQLQWKRRLPAYLSA